MKEAPSILYLIILCLGLCACGADGSAGLGSAVRPFHVTC